jgi:hypothetical protein
MHKLEWKKAKLMGRYVRSGGTLTIPKTSVERLVLCVRMQRLKTEFLKREEAKHARPH